VAADSWLSLAVLVLALVLASLLNRCPIRKGTRVFVVPMGHWPAGQANVRLLKISAPSASVPNLIFLLRQLRRLFQPFHD